jgi:hypothetical protein
MPDIERRDALKLIGLMAAAPTFAFSCTPSDDTGYSEQLDEKREASQRPGPDYERQFFTDHEYETVRMLADYVIPADEHSGSASDARVPEFIDSVMADEMLWTETEREERQTAMRGGLAWLDYQCLERYDSVFVNCTDAQRRDLLDLIAWPEQAPPEMQAGVEFFNSFRDLTASGFFSSKIGIKDLQYIGNAYVEEWTGCPDEVIEHVGLKA